MGGLTQRRINVEDLPGAPNWVPTLINPINLTQEDLVSFFDGRITIGDNVNGMLYSTSFSTPADYLTGGFNSFAWNYTGKFQPKNVLIGSIVCTKPVEDIIVPTSVYWTYNNGVSPNQVRVKYVAGLKASQTYSINLLVL